MLPVKTDFPAAFRALVTGEVAFIVIGGVAAMLHGVARTTYDVDVVYSRDRANLARLAQALAPHAPYLRGAPQGLPFVWDESTLRHGLNFTLETLVGDIDLLGEVPGGGSYRELFPHSETAMAFGFSCRVVRLEKLIQLKRAAGRPKDLEPIAELQALLEERQRGTP